eukprot:gene17946-biopygen37969
MALARERYRRLPDGVPAKAAAERMRLTDRARQLYADAGISDVPREAAPTGGDLGSWGRAVRARFYPTAALPVRRDDELEKKRHAMRETLTLRGDFEAEIWVDGSCTGGTDKGGAGGAIYYCDGRREPRRFSQPAGRKASSWICEMRAIRQALSMLRDDELGDAGRVLVATDSKGAIEAIAAGPEGQRTKVGTGIWRELQRLFPSAREREVIFQHVCSHCDEPGERVQYDKLRVGCSGGVAAAPWWHYNAAADELAKRGAREKQEDVPIDLSTAKAALRAAREKWWVGHLDAEMKSSEWEQPGAPAPRKHWYRRVIEDGEGRLRLNTHRDL